MVAGFAEDLKVAGDDEDEVGFPLAEPVPHRLQSPTHRVAACRATAYGGPGLPSQDLAKDLVCAILERSCATIRDGASS